MFKPANMNTFTNNNDKGVKYWYQRLQNLYRSNLYLNFNSLWHVSASLVQLLPDCNVAFKLCVLQVEVLYGDEPLKDYYTLMDIAYFYEWRRVSSTFQISDIFLKYVTLTLSVYDRCEHAGELDAWSLLDNSHVNVCCIDSCIKYSKIN